MLQHHRRTALATATAAALTGGLLTFAAAAPATAADSTVVPQADFNGDGKGDVAFSASGAYVNGKKEAGQLVVLYGTSTGISGAKRSTISQETSGVPGSAETGDAFGSDAAYADFNNDGYDDLAVTSMGEDVGSDADAGSVTLLWGSAQGLTGKSTMIADPAPYSHDKWGLYLAAGDFDGDGKADLAVSSTSTTVYVFKGGFSSTGKPGGTYTIKPPVVSGSYPLNLTAGDVNGDGRTDLVVDGYENRTEYGWNRNYWIPGTASGLSMASAKELRPGIITAIGDVNHDGYGDIVSGAPWETTIEDGTAVPYSGKGGKVWITYGTASGPGSATGITQDTAGVPGNAEKNDEFGSELDLGDINGDKYLDLVIGSPGEDIGTHTDTGMVTVLYGSPSGISTSGAQSFAQSNPGVPGNDEKYDELGLDVKLDDVNGDGKADLIASSAENSGDGAVLYLPSDGKKITTSGDRMIMPSDAGVSTTGTPLFGANFGD
ncbi:VCBS repeat-containing protein [Streptomyces sp. MK7]|uniref:VCBS repeat-containing protein n=1 Tax=Streptomyces sp. MK7 TaxID=3067635 RepID=UPI0029302316|nr:VCBS repeat-containing protein [Streptomyces sp. MK7]